MKSLKVLKNNSLIFLKEKVVCVLIIAFFLSCNQNTFGTDDEMMRYLQDMDNGYKHEKVVNGFKYSLLYRPTDLLVKQEIGDREVTKNELQQLKDKYSKYMYFNLSMSKNNKELLSTAPNNRNEFGAMVNQLAFKMNDKVHLYTQIKDTLEMVDYIYPRLYGMSKATTMMFVYPRDNERLKQKDLNFTIEDFGLFTGEVRFKIKTEKIKKEPRLSF